jgi:hypothetical protein
MDEIGAALQTACREQAGATLEQMGTALVTGFLDAKMKDPKASVALYSVSSDVDGAEISRQMSLKANRAIVAMLASAKDELTTDPELVASMLQAIMAGVSRQMVESASPESNYERLRDELVRLVCTYLRSCEKSSV